MNSYIWLSRIRGPVLLLTFGVTALLDQWNILSFGRSWPLYLIVLGVLQLAQRLVLASAPATPYPPAGLPYGGYPGGTPGPAEAATQSTALSTTRAEGGD